MDKITIECRYAFGHNEAARMWLNGGLLNVRSTIQMPSRPRDPVRTTAKPAVWNASHPRRCMLHTFAVSQ